MPPMRGASGWMMSAAPRFDQPDVFADTRQHLPGGDRRVQRSRELRMSERVVRVERLLDPHQVELLQHAAEPQCRRPVPLLVRIHHQRYAVAEVLADRADPLEVDPRVRLPDLDLDPADAVRQRFRRALLDLLDRRVQEPTGRVVRPHRVAMRAEQLGQRQTGPLRLQIPQRDVDRRDRLRRHAGPPDRRARPEQLVVHLRDVRRILADKPAATSLACAYCAGPPARFE